jgi:hypothetical protein
MQNMLIKSYPEQRYIDTTRNFALSLPQEWLKVEMPISSPRGPNDLIRWTLRQKGSAYGSLSLQQLPLSGLVLEEVIAKFELKDNPVKITEREHPLGPCLEFSDRLPDGQRRSLVAVQGRSNIFVLTFTWQQSENSQRQERFQQVIDSLDELGSDTPDGDTHQ